MYVEVLFIEAEELFGGLFEGLIGGLQGGLVASLSEEHGDILEIFVK